MLTFRLEGLITDESANNCIAFLNEHQTEDVQLVFSSPGGSVFSANAILRAMENHRANITCYIESIAASAAGFLALCGSKLLVNNTSMLMLHSAWTQAEGNAKELREVADTLETVTNAIKNIIKEKTALMAEEIDAMFDRESWFNASDIVETFNAEMISVQDIIFNKASMEGISMYCKEIPQEIQDKLNEDDLTDDAKATVEDIVDNTETEVEETIVACATEDVANVEDVVDKYADIRDLLNKVDALNIQ